MYSAEGTGKTIEKAIENALFELKATREDVDIKIINEGGLFKKAKVVVTISEDAIAKYEKVNKIVKEEKAEEIAKKEAEIAEKEEAKKEKAEAKQEKKEAKTEVKAEAKKEKSAKKEEKKAQEDEDEDDDEVVEKPIKNIDPEEFLKNFFEKAGKEVTISITEDENYRTYHVDGENLGDMIGHRGECFYAISRLVSAVIGRQDKKLLIDIGDYREKRKEGLTQLALRSASKVAKSGRYLKLEPMNPSDRRIIHTALQNDDRVTTLSKGTEPHRYVIVFPKEYDEK